MNQMANPDTWMFIPGPVNVEQTVRDAMARPPINHRGAEFKALFEALRPKVQELMQTSGNVYFSTSSAIGIQEAVARNCVGRRALHLSCGSFGENWHHITQSCGKETDLQETDWGRANRPETLRAALDTGRYDTVCMVHSETSTSVQNPLEEIAAVMRDFPEIVFCVDAVSSLGAAPVRVDDWGIDVCFASVQKGLACPPGFAVFSVSTKAMERARNISGRGYYFDFLIFEKYAGRSHTPTTPSIPHLNALNRQLDRIKDEGLSNRWERHRRLAELSQQWADEHFACFAEAPHRSYAVTAVTNTRGLDIVSLNRFLAESNMALAGGYGKLKSETFRIGHVGETQIDQLETLFGQIEQFMKSHPQAS